MKESLPHVPHHQKGKKGLNHNVNKGDVVEKDM
jgi:hypothetical protein